MFYLSPQATSETYAGTVLMISSGLTAIPIFLGIFMHFRLKGKRIAEFPSDEDDEENIESKEEEKKDGKVAESDSKSAEESNSIKSVEQVWSWIKLHVPGDWS